MTSHGASAIVLPTTAWSSTACRLRGGVRGGKVAAKGGALGAGGHGMSGQEPAGRGAEGQGAAGGPRPGTFFIRTYGCQMNLYDSGRMADLLAARGMKRADAPEGADLVVLNTCHIREKAAEKVYSELGRLARLRRPDGRRPLLAVAGCVAQGEGAGGDAPGAGCGYRRRAAVL